MAFDPSKPFTVVDSNKAPAFDPSKPFEAVEPTEENKRVIMPLRGRDAPYEDADANKVSVMDWMAKEHGIGFEDIQADYEAPAKQAGLSGNPDSDFEAITHRQEILDSRRNTIIKRAPGGTDAARASLEKFGEAATNVPRMGASSLSKAGYRGTAGVIDLAGLSMNYAPAGLAYRMFTGESVRGQAEQFSSELRGLADASAEAFGVGKWDDQSTFGQFMDQGGILASSLATGGTLAFGQLYTEAVQDSEQELGVKFSEFTQDQKDAAALKGVAYTVVGGVLDRTGLKYIGGGKLKGFLAGKVQLPKTTLMRVLQAGAIEAGTESMQGQLLDTLSVILENSDRELFGMDMLKRRATEAIWGGLMGAGASATFQGLEIADRGRESTQQAEIGAAMDRQLPFKPDGTYNESYRPMPIFDANGNADTEIVNLMRDYQKAAAEFKELNEKEEPEGGFPEEEQAKRKELEDSLDSMASKFNDLIDTRLSDYGMNSDLGQTARALQVFNAKVAAGLDPMTGATDLDWKFLNENFSDEEAADHVLQATNDPELVPVALAAKHGDTTAQEEYVERTAVDIESDPTGELSEQERASLQGADSFDAESDINDFLEEQGNRRVEGEVGDMVEFIQARQLEGSTIEMTDETYTLRNEMDEMLNQGYTPEAVERFAFERIRAAGQNAGEDYIAQGIKPEQMQIFGRNQEEFKRNVFRDVSRIFKGANPLDVVEEAAEGFAKRMVAEGVHTYEDFRLWKADIEQKTGQRTHGDTDGEIIEWISEQSKAWIVGQSRVLDESEVTPGSFRAWLRQAYQYFKHVFQHAARLKKLQRDGILDKNFETFLERSLGLDEAYLEQRFNEEMERQQLQEEFDPADELLAKVRNLGGIPTIANATNYKGELRDLKEGFGKRWNTLARKDALQIDELRGRLESEGFNFVTEDDLIEALRNATRGEELYPMQDERSAQDQWGSSFSMRPTDTAAFKAWFGDSKVVDENGEPLVVYHGTDVDFEAFDVNSQNTTDNAFFVTPDRDLAERYGKNIIQLYVSVKNPFIHPNNLPGAREGYVTKMEFVDSFSDEGVNLSDIFDKASEGYAEYEFDVMSYMVR